MHWDLEPKAASGLPLPKGEGRGEGKECSPTVASNTHTPRATLVTRHSTLITRPSTLATRLAFTLIELLVVIAIMAVLAALIIPITGAVNRHKLRSRTRAELRSIETAIEDYKTKRGYYPPDNPNSPLPLNQLYYELSGTGAQWLLHHARRQCDGQCGHAASRCIWKIPGEWLHEYDQGWRG